MMNVLSTLAILLLLVACQTERLIEPAALQGKTWVRQSGTYRLTPNWPDAEQFYNKLGLLVEFDRTGKLLYGTSKEIAFCCAPYSYRSSANSIEFKFDNPSPDPICARIDCTLSELTAGVTWQIDRLTATDLIIRTDKQRIVFKAQ